MKRTMKTVDKYLSNMKKLENLVKRNKRLIILKTRMWLKPPFPAILSLVPQKE